MFTTLKQSFPAKTRALHAAGAALAISLGLGLYQFAYAAWGDDVVGATRRIEQLRKLRSTHEIVATEHRDLVARTETLTVAVKAARQRMPELAPAAGFIDRASELARSFNMAVVQCTAGPPQTAPTHTTVEVTCRLTGSFASMCHFLAAVDQMPQIAKVARLEIKSARNSAAYPIQLTFQLYYEADLHDTEEERVAL
jgi:Tfp pilus assembly protein PilO